MFYTKTDLSYLYGQNFTNAYHFQLVQNENCSRIDTLVELCKGKRIIHFGCCDHIPLIEKKIRENTWLQKILCENCESVVGIDIDSNAVNYVLDNNFSKNIFCVNILETPAKITEILNEFDSFDYILCGEILEHTENPVLFLQKMKEVFSPYCNKIIITVPNALSIHSKFYSSKFECINSDHKFWFTPYTISKVMTMADIEPFTLLFIDKVNRVWLKILSKLLHSKKLLSVNNTKSSGLLCIGKLKDL